MPNLSKKVQNFSHKNNLFWEGQKIIVGISGGADSTCLLEILIELSKKYRFSLHVAHVNYNLRGKDSQKDQDFVEKMCKKSQIEASFLFLSKLKETSNLENKLRKIRYEFFEKIRRELVFDSIAVAHNRDDQAETVLLRIIRGTGLQGMSSMKPKNGNIIRPLLDVSRKEIAHYLNNKNIKFRTDKTNLEPIFTRNKVRLELIPYLEKNFNPSIKESLAGLAEISGLDHDFIAESAKKDFKFSLKNGVAKFATSKALDMHPAILREGLRMVISYVKSNLIDIDSSHIDEIEKIIKSNKNKNQKAFFKGLKIEKRGDIVSILPQKAK